jgi:hypothetical protein
MTRMGNARVSYAGRVAERRKSRSSWHTAHGAGSAPCRQGHLIQKLNIICNSRSAPQAMAWNGRLGTPKTWWKLI